MKTGWKIAIGGIATALLVGSYFTFIKLPSIKPTSYGLNNGKHTWSGRIGGNAVNFTAEDEKGNLLGLHGKAGITGIFQFDITYHKDTNQFEVLIKKGANTVKQEFF